MKKSLIFVLCIFLIGFLSVTFAQDEDIDRVIDKTVPGVGIINDKINPEDLPDKISEINKNISAIRRGGQNYSFLSKEFKETLLKNEVISSINKVFENNSIIFRILFGMPYEFSLSMLFVFFMWLVVFLSLPDIVDYSGFFNRISCWGVSLLIVVILSQVQLFRGIVFVIDKIIYAPENAWIRWTLAVLIFALILLGYYLGKVIDNYFDKLKEEKERKDAKKDPLREKMKAFGKGLNEDLG